METLKAPRRTFVRGIWGSTGWGEPQPGLAKTHQDIRETLRRFEPVTPCINYCFGRENSIHLRRAGLKFEMFSRLPLFKFERRGPRDKKRGPMKGRLAWGLSLWRHKLECMREALKTHDEIIWIDWDTHLLRPLPIDFWQRLHEGQPIQGVLRQYHQPHCGWRDFDQRKITHGAFLYCREIRLLERIIEVHSKLCPTQTDEVAISYVIDEMIGGWKGVDAYYDLGFSPYCHSTRLNIRDPKEFIFCEGRRREEYRWRREWLRKLKKAA